MNNYDPLIIEPKIRKYWDDNDIYKSNLNSPKQKFLAMSMFNYPSGAGIHVGHAFNYTISDVIARYKRQRGFESYHPVGWDNFGSPAENFAIKTGTHPAKNIADTIKEYQKQYKAMGWSNDWSKEISTSEPEYYKWTQWIFIKLFEAGLAYQKESDQWWCDKCHTVIADAQVVNGKCWRHDGADDPILGKKGIKQWFFKITEYADELLAEIDNLNWTESVKLAQKNWIGRSSGLEIDFSVNKITEKLKVFTTAHDTIFGATFFVIAPEHPLLKKIVTNDNKSNVDDYLSIVNKKSELERHESKDKTGVFTGSYAIHPFTNELLPIWVADYVLMDYGTGAIMAVPGADERDYEFANKFGLKIVYLTNSNAFVSYSEIKENGSTEILINSGEYTGQKFADARKLIENKLVSLNCAKIKVNYKMRDWSVSRQRYWGAPIPIIHCEDCGSVAVDEKDLPLLLPNVENYQPKEGFTTVLAGTDDFVNVKCPKCGKMAKRETDTMDGYVCSSWYFLRYIDPHNAEVAWDTKSAEKWMPVDFYNGGDHAVAHLLYARFFMHFFYKLGLVKVKEPFKQMLFNGKVMAKDGAKFSKSKGNGPDPLKIIQTGIGADALRTYLMFLGPLEDNARWDEDGIIGISRFLNKVWKLTQDYIESQDGMDGNDSILYEVHQSVNKINNELEAFKYNTAIAIIMTLLNSIISYKSNNPICKNNIWKYTIESLLQVLTPFAPHITEELWQQIGKSTSIQIDNWPVIDQKYLVNSKTKIVISVNGKLRGEIEVDSDTDQKIIEQLAIEHTNVKPHISGEIKKFIYVKNKLINIVV